MPMLRRQGSSRGAHPEIDHAFVERNLVPIIRTLIRIGYFKLEAEGLEHVPREGRVVYALNHAGWFPLDAFFAALAVSQAVGPSRMPFFAASDVALAAPVLGPFLSRVGALPASWFRRPERLPPEVQACGIFPEGVEGNTKPFWQAYRMRPWKRGFVRVAAALDASIVPVAVLGGEECLPVAVTVKRLEPLIGSIFGLPVSVLPLPARWRIVFHPPVRVEGGREALRDPEYQTRLAAELRGVVQQTIDRHAAKKPLGRLSAMVEATSRSLPAPLRRIARA